MQRPIYYSAPSLAITNLLECGHAHTSEQTRGIGAGKKRDSTVAGRAGPCRLCSMLLCETFSVGPFASNCTVLGCADTKDAVIIDAGGGVDRIKEYVDRYHLTIKAIILTHGHLDHVSATGEIHQAQGGEIWMHEADRQIYESSPAQAVMFGLPAGQPVPPIDHFFTEGDGVEFGKKKAVVIHTPGHTPGSVCLKVEDEGKEILFSGDTLFQRGIGRTDLPGGSSSQLIDSIKNKLYKLKPETRVIAGHGGDTTIGEEMAQNPFVRA